MPDARTLGLPAEVRPPTANDSKDAGPASSGLGERPSLDTILARAELQALGIAAERLLTLPNAERPQRERNVLSVLHFLARELDLGHSATPETVTAARALESLLKAILEQDRPVEEREFLNIIRLLVTMGCWESIGSAG